MKSGILNLEKCVRRNCSRKQIYIVGNRRIDVADMAVIKVITMCRRLSTENRLIMQWL